MRAAIGVIVLIFFTSAGAVAQTIAGDYLTRHGIAVLRADDRGVAKSGGQFASATTTDFATDGEAGVAYLRTRHEIDGKKIGLIGHSEGGLIAPLVASRDRGIAFVVMMAGTGVRGDELLVRQNVLVAESMGATRAQPDAQGAQIRTLVDIVMRETDDAARAAKLRQALAGTVPEAAIDARVKTLLDPWFKQFLAYDPAPVLAKLTCPVLALNGQLDKQVPPDQNLPAIRAAFTASGNRHVDVEELPGLNHLFQTAKTGSPAEYAQIEETIAPQALDKIVGWILKQPARVATLGDVAQQGSTGVTLRGHRERLSPIELASDCGEAGPFGPYPIYRINCISIAQRCGYHPAVPASPSPHPPCPRCKESEGVKEAYLLEGTLRWFICRTCMHVWSLSPTPGQTS